jgi:hypothetical protein
LKKRTKKLLSVGLRASWIGQASGDEGAGAKIFCFFFSKKKAFLPFFRDPLPLAGKRALLD